MDFLRSAFRTFGNIAPIEDEVLENYLYVFSIRIVGGDPYGILTDPFDFELEFPREIFEIDFRGMGNNNSPTPNGTKFEILEDSNEITLRVFRTIEFGELVLLVDWHLRSTVDRCTLEVGILERDLEREEETYVPCPIYTEGLVEGDKKPFVQRLVSLFEHIRP